MAVKVYIRDRLYLLHSHYVGFRVMSIYVAMPNDRPKRPYRFLRGSRNVFTKRPISAVPYT